MSASDSARAVELSRKSALAANVLMNTVCAPRLLEMVDTNSPETGQTFHEECLKGVARADVVVGFTDQGIEPSRLRFEFLSLQTSRHFDLESLRMPPSADGLPMQGSYTMTLAAQYCGYYSCMARTILVDPPETVKTAYSIAEKVHLSTIKSLTDGAVLKDVYLGAKQKVLAEAPQLAPLFIKSMGFVIKGRELRDTSLEITETCHGKVHAGMVVFVSTGFGTQASEAEQQEKSSEQQWAFRIGDTVIVKNSNTHEVPTHDSSKHPGVIFEIGSELEQEASASAVTAEEIAQHKDGAAGTPSSATEKPAAATEKPAAAATRKRKGPDGEATAEAEAAKAKVRAEEKEAKAAAKQLSDEAKAKARAEAKEAKKKAKEEAKAKAKEEAQEAKAKARAEAQAAKADGKVAPKRVPASPVPCKERSTNQATPDGDAMQNGEKEAKGPAETDDKAKQSSKRRRLVSTEVAYEQRERARACDRENVEIKDSDEEDEERRKSSDQQESMKDKRKDQAGEGQIREEKDEEEEGEEEPEHDKEEAKHHADKAAASGGAQARDKAKASKPPRRVVSRKRRRRAKRPSGAAAAAASAAEAEVKTHSAQEVRTAMANSMLMGCMLGLAMSKCFDSLLQPTR